MGICFKAYVNPSLGSNISVSECLMPTLGLFFLWTSGSKISSSASSGMKGMVSSACPRCIVGRQQHRRELSTLSMEENDVANQEGVFGVEACVFVCARFRPAYPCHIALIGHK